MLCGPNPGKKHGKPTANNKLRGLLRKKKKQVEDWEKAKREFDSVGGTPFNGVRAIAKRHNVARARLKRYTNRNAKRNHGYDTDSSALGGDSEFDDSWDGDSDATM